MHCKQSMEKAMRMRARAAIALVVALLCSGASASPSPSPSPSPSQCSCPCPCPSPAPAPSPSPYEGNIAIYWGQHTEEASLGETCATGNFEIVLVAYLEIGIYQTPQINVAGHPIDKVREDIKSCQSSGVKVFLSLDGIIKSPDDAQDAENLSIYLWNNFLGGNSGSGPLGDAVLDGIDLGSYEGSSMYWDVLVTALSSLSTSEKKVYLSAFPQCPYPDAYLQKALETGLFDYVWIEFYNNPPCHFANGNAINLLDSWNEWTTKVNTTQTHSVYLGLAAAPDDATNGGYIEPEELISQVLPYTKDSPQYGGVLLSSKYSDEKTGYSSKIKPSALMEPSSVDVSTLASV